MQNGGLSPYLQEETYKNTRQPTERALSLIPDAYTDNDFFALEQKQVFGRNWVCVGPVARVMNGGDIMVAEVGGQSIIITRDEAGALRAFTMFAVIAARACVKKTAMLKNTLFALITAGVITCAAIALARRFLTKAKTDGRLKCTTCRI